MKRINEAESPKEIDQKSAENLKYHGKKLALPPPFRGVFSAAFLAADTTSRPTITIPELALHLLIAGMGIATFILAIFYFFKWKKRISFRLRLFLLMLFFVFLVTITITYQIKVKEERDSLQSMIANIQSHLQNKIIHPENVPPSERNAATAQNEVREYMRELVQSARENRANYVRRLEEAGWNAFLDLDRLARDKDLSQTKQLIEEAGAAFTDYKNGARDLYDEKIPRLAEAAGEAFDARTVTDLEGLMRQGRDDLEELLRMEKEVLALFADVFTILERTKGTWTASGKGLLFTKTEDAEEFNRTFDRLRKKIQEQETAYSARMGLPQDSPH